MKKITFKKGIEKVILPAFRPVYFSDPIRKEAMDNFARLDKHYQFSKGTTREYVLRFVEGDPDFLAQAQVNIYKK